METAVAGLWSCYYADHRDVAGMSCNKVTRNTVTIFKQIEHYVTRITSINTTVWSTKTGCSLSFKCHNAFKHHILQR